MCRVPSPVPLRKMYFKNNHYIFTLNLLVSNKYYFKDAFLQMMVLTFPLLLVNFIIIILKILQGTVLVLSIHENLH